MATAKAKKKAAPKKVAPKKATAKKAEAAPLVPVRSKAEAALRAYALSLPGAEESFPWGHRVMKVNKKAFVFMGNDDGGLSMSTKLPASGEIALTLPFAEPTGYGLGKSGWVSARFGPKEKPPVPMLKEWIEESYRAIAPKKLVATL